MNNTTLPRPLTAPQLYAMSQNDPCFGINECYFCASPCTSERTHTQPPPQPFMPFNRSHVKRLMSPWICRGCWLFRRTRITVDYLSTGANGRAEMTKDIQAPMNHSWYITEKGAWAIRLDTDQSALYEALLDPPLRFCMSLLTGKEQTHLQIVPVNDCHEIRGDTPLSFSVDGVNYVYTTYELNESLNGKIVSDHIPGVRRLIELLGLYETGRKTLSLKNESEKERTSGRPKIPIVIPGNGTGRVITKMKRN